MIREHPRRTQVRYQEEEKKEVADGPYEQANQVHPAPIQHDYSFYDEDDDENLNEEQIKEKRLKIADSALIAAVKIYAEIRRASDL